MGQQGQQDNEAVQVYRDKKVLQELGLLAQLGLLDRLVQQELLVLLE